MGLFGRSDTGRVRANNEDCIFISSGAAGVFDELMIVCDGMGGASYGEVASSVCAQTISDYIKNAPVDNPEFIIEQAVSVANLNVRKEAEALDAPDMGTTCVLAGLIGHQAYIVNIGDSRAYLIDRNKYTIRQITRDHSFVEEQVARGLIERHSPEYEQNKHMITRAVGIYAETDPDYFQLKLGKGQMLLLCSDGLSNMVSDVVMKNLALDRTLSLEKRVDSLVRLANENGGYDNISVILYEEDK